MPCNLLQNQTCLQALQNDGTNLTPATEAEVATVFSQAGLANSFSQICSNITNFGQPCTGTVAQSQTSSSSDVSFVLAPFVMALSKSVKLAPSMAGELENRIADLFAKNDEALVANGFQMPDLTGTVGPIVPYNALATPQGYNNNVTHKGWSRVAWPFFNASDSQQQSARARIELLTDGMIISAITEGICCLKECGLGNSVQQDEWLTCIKTIIEAHEGGWVQNASIAIDPAITGTTTNIIGSGFVDGFGNIIPVNQQAIFLDAMVRYEQCSGDTSCDAKGKAAAFVSTVNAHQFYTVGGVDQGFYYSLKANVSEVAEDYGHSAITTRSLKAMVECGVTGASALLTRLTDALMNNSYQGNGQFAWYSDGNTQHGTTPSVNSGLINWGAMGSNTSFNGGSGANGNVEFYNAWIWTELPSSISNQYSTQINSALDAYIATDGTGNHNNALARMCLAMNACFDDTVITNNPTCTNTTQTITPGTTIPAAFLATGGTPGYTLSNFTSSTTFLTMISGGSGIVASTDLTPGTYTVSYTITDQAGNSTTCQHAVVYQASDMTCQVTVRDVDPNSTIQSVSLVSGGTGPFTISNFQSGSSAITSTDLAISIGNIDPGSYDLSYTITDSSNTSVNCSLRVTYVDQCSVGCSVGVTVSGAENQLCIGSDPVSLCVGVDTSTGNQINNEPGYSYKTCNSECCGVGLDSAILWCNLCLRKDVTVTSTGVIEGSDRFVCECEDGLFLEFEDELTYTLTSTSEQGADSFVIWGHDLCSGAEIQLFHDGVEVDLQSHDGTTAVLSEGCSHCGTDNGCKAVAMFFECTTATTRQVVIKAPGRHRINRMGWMQSWDVELEIGHASEHNASQYEIDYKTNLCGEVIGGTRKPRTNTVDITLTDVDRHMLKHEWRPIRDYLENLYPIYWIEDKNCPSDLSMGHLNPVENTVYTSPCEQTITIPLNVRTFAGVK